MNKYITAIVIISALLFTSCSNNSTSSDTTKEEVTLIVTIDHAFGLETVDPEVSIHTNTSGNEIRFSKLHYLLTNFVLVNSIGEEIVLDSAVAYINMADGRVTFQLPNIPEDDYIGLKFLLGVDSISNHQNPNLFAATSPLNPIINNLYWDWLDGFIFCSLEGYHFKDGQPKGAFAYHIGLDENLMRINIENKFNVKKGTTIKLNFDLAAFFEYPYVINITENAPITHSDKAADFGLSSKLSKNLLNAFTIKGDN
jgi:methanobactin biosynthesis MbnP-like protein